MLVGDWTGARVGLIADPWIGVAVEAIADTDTTGADGKATSAVTVTVIDDSAMPIRSGADAGTSIPHPMKVATPNASAAIMIFSIRSIYAPGTPAGIVNRPTSTAFFHHYQTETKVTVAVTVPW
jgi:hypothetical protein